MTRVAVLCAAAALLASHALAQGEAGSLGALDLSKGRVGFAGGALGVVIDDADIASDHVYDYTFSSAPTDWLARSGEWNATSRWTCSPQWSWYGGFSPDGLAAFWNKRYFEGDVTVEMHSAFKMRANRDPVYLHPNDVNISLCGDGINPDSGYSFIIGGDENRSTRIMRGTKVLAETSDLGALWPIYENAQPETYQWHRKWWSLRARKSGPKLQIYFDERLVLEATDPQPLTGGRVGVWVLRNDMITPRIKIYFEGERLPRPPLPDDGFALAPVDAVAPAQVTLSSATHPSVQNDFENELGRWASRDADQGALLTIVPGGADGTGHALRLINRAAGGSFGANILPDRFDARQLSQITFDYRLSPDAKVNLYLTCGERVYEIVFSGMKTPARGCFLLGQITDVRADDRWHHARFDLLGALLAAQGPEPPMICQDLWVGNRSNEGYLLAGFGGNHWNATWHLDNFVLGRAGGEKLELAIAPKSGVEVDGYAVAVDDQPEGASPAEVNLKVGPYTADLAGEGPRYAHVRPRLKDGSWGSTVTYRLGVDKSAPGVAAVEPAPGGPLPDTPVSVRLTDPGGSGLDLRSLALELDGKELKLGSPGVAYDGGTGTVTVDPAQAGVTVSSGGLDLSLVAVSDQAGNALAGPVKWRFAADLKGDKRPPTLPQITLADPYFCDNDFERGLGEWASYGGPEGAVLSRDDLTANTGSHSLKLYCKGVNRRFGAYCVQRPFDAAKYRIVRFAYKCDSRLRVDFAVYVNGDWKGIRFTDNDNDLGVIGQVPGVQTDDQWHVAAFDLYSMLRRDDPKAPTLIVRQFVLADWGWKGNRDGSTYHLDDFQLVPVVSGTSPLQATWSSLDSAGFEGATYTVTADAVPAVPDSVSVSTKELSIDFGALTDAWLHLKARDKAGNWSPVVSREVLVDSQAPSATVLEPAAGAKTAVSEVRLQLADQGLAGVDPTSLRLRVAGADYAVDNQGLRYDPASGQLIWSCEEVYPKPVVFADQQKIDVALLAASDYAGNAPAELPSWSWQMDYAQDHKPPVASAIQSTSHPTLMTDTFENGDLGMWKGRDGKNGATVELDTTEAASGTACVKLTQQRKGGHMQATIWQQPYPVERYPVIAFDYKVPPETRLVLNFLVNGNWYAVMLNDAAPGVIGKVPGFTADDTWRHAQFDLKPILQPQVKQGTPVVEQIIVGDRDPLTTPEGAVARFDNFVIGQIGRYAPVLRWRATDTTGIAGFSYSLDRDPATVPDEVSEGVQPAKTFDALQPGIWYFHLRAQDGAGNWGPPKSYALLHLKAE